VLRLASETRADWVAEAAAAVPTLLVDHAHCEKKAASTAMNLIFRYVGRTGLMAPLSALAREELAHFELVLRVLEERGIPFVRLEPPPYAARLMAAVRPAEPARLVDTLLCCSLIEARSCERMRLLSEHLPDPALAGMYRSLLASEARHHQSYVDLALDIAPRAEVLARLDALAEHEAAVVAERSPAFRFHG
jgi:tRNA-(ms[2]io[6]A)-hydroxylase